MMSGQLVAGDLERSLVMYAATFRRCDSDRCASLSVRVALAPFSSALTFLVLPFFVALAAMAPLLGLIVISGILAGTRGTGNICPSVNRRALCTLQMPLRPRPLPFLVHLIQN